MDIGSTSAVSQNTAVNSIGIEDFIKILASQLTNQDPLKPLDNQEFVAQIAQFTTLEQSSQLNQKIDQLLSTQSVAQSVGLLGKTVDINSANGPVTGQVVALALSSGQPLMTVQMSTGATLAGIGLAQIDAIR